MTALNDLENIINNTNNIINCFNALSTPLSTTSEIENIEKLLNERDAQLRLFFDKYPPNELEGLNKPLNQLYQQDQELAELANKIKKEMSQQILKQKKNDKVKNIYKNI